MKRSSRTLAICALSVAFLVLAAVVCQRAYGQTPTNIPVAAQVNAVYINLDSTYLDPVEGYSVIRAFIPTGSKSPKCLATLSELGSNYPLTGITMFCALREPSAFGGVPGVLVSIFFPQPQDSSLVVSLTLYQQGVTKYGHPVLCTLNDGC